MPVELSRDQDHNVAVVRCSGNVTLDDITASVAHAFSTRQIEPGMDRIVMFDPRARLHELDLNALQTVQRMVMEQEKGRSGDIKFRSVLVVAAEEHQGILKLYKALWELVNLPKVEFYLANSKQRAFELLATPSRSSPAPSVKPARRAKARPAGRSRAHSPSG